jgi:hypothetical protein
MEGGPADGLIPTGMYMEEYNREVPNKIIPAVKSIVLHQSAGDSFTVLFRT